MEVHIARDVMALNERVDILEAEIETLKSAIREMRESDNIHREEENNNSSTTKFVDTVLPKHYRKRLKTYIGRASNWSFETSLEDPINVGEFAKVLQECKQDPFMKEFWSLELENGVKTYIKNHWFPGRVKGAKQSKKGNSDEKRIKRNRYQRKVRKCADRLSSFNKHKEHFPDVIVKSAVSLLEELQVHSEEVSTEQGNDVFFQQKPPEWRPPEIENFLTKLDDLQGAYNDGNKSRKVRRVRVESTVPSSSSEVNRPAEPDSRIPADVLKVWRLCKGKLNYQDY